MVLVVLDTAVELYYNTEGDRNSVVNQASCRMDVTHAYIKIVLLRGRNARECHIELMEAVGN